MISGVAFKQDETDIVFSLPAPNRHHHIIREMVKIGENPRKGVQGFVTNHGDFLDREEALKYAYEHDLILLSDDPSELFSEDLW